MFVTREQFERRIQDKYDKRLAVRVNTKGAPDCAGVHFCGYYIGVTIGAEGIYKKRNPNHTDMHGVVWRGADEADHLVKVKLGKFKRDFANGLYDK